MRLSRRVLFLTDDSNLVASQLAGTDLVYTGQPLQYGVNTDAMISGGNCTLGYTPTILGPYFLEHFHGIDTGAVLAGGFQVIVGGEAYGSGSSREVAVVAHQGAGIELVVAHSFQRIFQENLVYGGVPFTTDFSVLDRLQAGEDVDIAALNADLPPFFAQVAGMGGLLNYGKVWLAGEVAPWYSTTPVPRPMTVVERIIANHTWVGNHGAAQQFGIEAVQPGDQVLCHAAFRGVHEYTAGMVVALYREAFGDTPVYNPDQIAAFEDHFVLIDQPTVQPDAKRLRLASSQALTAEMLTACAEYGIPVHGPGRDLPAGVCHRIVVERYALPGDIVVLTDSHTPTAGVLNTFAFGVGSTAMAFAFRTGLIPVTVPKTVRVVLTGQPRDGLVPKDIILHIIGDAYFREEQWRTSPTDTCVIQFGGPGLDHYNVDELSVLTNMTVEGGLMTGVIEPCAAMSHFLALQHGDAMAECMVHPDAGAHYERIIEVDLAQVPITVATPGDSRNALPLAVALEGAEGDPIPVHNVVIASCTGGSLSDLRQAAEVLRGRTIAHGVRVTVTPSSAGVFADAEAEGILDLFRNLGAVVTPPGCGSCIGNGPGIPNPGETTASTTNRNFERRMGAPGPVYLVSPAVAAACAVTGFLTDPIHLPPRDHS